MIASDEGGLLYFSYDGGSTWVTDASPGSQNWADVTINGDGTRGGAVAKDGFIYIFGPGVTIAPSTVCM